MQATEGEALSGLFEKMKELFGQLVPDTQTVTEAFKNMTGAANDINKAFTESRQRITEMMVLAADSKPVFARLGGEITDVVKTITSIGEATRKNVLASTEDASKLFSVSRLIDVSVTDIVSRFADVGTSFSQAGRQMETSINYVRSIGANTKEVMSVVLSQMDNMNRYNFQNGVEGMTRMAAQASTLRFNMQTTLDLAEQALKPERAVELASAFQRLGVAVGDLGDPFGLMSKSLMDPEGLQKNLVDMSKQFAYFDDQTKSFKISPEGMLRMRELQEQTGLSAREMSKMALGAVELDKKLGLLKPSIKFDNEEDKQFLMNIARMDKSGEYVVNISDTETKRLQDITQDEMNKLIEQQKSAPKTTEDILRDSMDIQTAMKTELQSIRNSLEYGFASSAQFRRNIEGARRVGTGVTGALREVAPTTPTVRKEVEGIFEDIGQALKSVGLNNEKQTDEALSRLEKRLEQYEGSIGEGLGNTMEKLKNATKGTSEFETLYNQVFKEIEGIKTEWNKAKQTPSTTTQTTPQTRATTTPISSTTTTPQAQTLTQTMNNNVTINGGDPIRHVVEAPPGVSVQYLTNLINSQDFADKITKMVSDRLAETGVKPLVKGPKTA